MLKGVPMLAVFRVRAGCSPTRVCACMCVYVGFLGEKYLCFMPFLFMNLWVSIIMLNSPLIVILHFLAFPATPNQFPPAAFDCFWGGGLMHRIAAGGAGDLVRLVHAHCLDGQLGSVAVCQVQRVDLGVALDDFARSEAVAVEGFVFKG